MSTRLPLIASLFALCLSYGACIPLHAETAPEPAAAATTATAEATVSAWIKALNNNDIASFYTSLPEARQHELSTSWTELTSQANQAGQGQQGRRGGGRNMLAMTLDRPLQGLQSAESAKGVAQTLAGILGQFAVLVQPSTAPAPAMPALPDGQQWMQFMQRGMAQSVLSACTTDILADGLETRQIATLQTLFTDYSLWAATGLDDDAKLTAATEQLVALGAALQLKSAADLATVDLATLLTRCNVALPALKQTLLAFGLNADATLASAKIVTESTSGDTSIVVVSFTAFAKSYTLPLKLKNSAAGCAITADSPALRWMRGGGMPGGMMRGGPGGGQWRQGWQQGGPGQQPAPTPPPGQANF